MVSGRALFVDGAIEHLVCIGTTYNPCYLGIVGTLGNTAQVGSFITTQATYLNLCAIRNVAMNIHCRVRPFVAVRILVQHYEM